MTLNANQKKFVAAYCNHLNGAQAARDAGYSEKRAKQTASELLGNKEIKAAIEAILDTQAKPAPEAVRRLTDMGRATMAHFIQIKPIMTIFPLKKDDDEDDEDEDDVDEDQTFPLAAVIDLTTEEAKQYYHLIKKMKQGKYGIEIELHDSKDAIVKLLEVQGKIKGAGDNKTEITIFQLPHNGR